MRAAPDDFYPEDLRPEIDAWNTRIYDRVNNGVDKAGFATTQEANEAAFAELFAGPGYPRRAPGPAGTV